MKITVFSLFLKSLALTTVLTISTTGCGNEALKDNTTTAMDESDDYEISAENAHPNAQKLMTEEFYWDIVDENSPFGNDDGWDAFYGFRAWRQSNMTTTPVVYVRELLEGWGHPALDFSEQDSDKIRNYVQSAVPDRNSPHVKLAEQLFRKTATDAGSEYDDAEFEKIMQISLKSLGQRSLNGTDNAIIAVGLGQFILEGKIDQDMMFAVKTAVARQLLPPVLDQWGELKNERAGRLKLILTLLERSKGIGK